MKIELDRTQSQSLKEHIEGCDYCYICNCHPGTEHHGHQSNCPLKAEWHNPDKCDICQENE